MGLFLLGAWFSSWYVVSIDTGHITQNPQSGPRLSSAFKIEPVLFPPSPKPKGCSIRALSQVSPAFHAFPRSKPLRFLGALQGHRSRWTVSFVPFSGLSTEKAMAALSSTLAWKIPWTEKPDGLQFMRSLRVGHY